MTKMQSQFLLLPLWTLKPYNLILSELWRLYWTVGFSIQCQRRRMKISIICVPKTIDNDILLMDKTFGFDTAVEEAQRAINSAYIEVKVFGIRKIHWPVHKVLTQLFSNELLNFTRFTVQLCLCVFLLTHFELLGYIFCDF